jgi:hypothetical protein
MRHRQRLRQHAGGGEASQQLAAVHQAGLDGWHQEQQGGDAEASLQDGTDPSGRGEMTDQAGQRYLGPSGPAAGGDEDQEGDREQDRPRRDQPHDDPRRPAQHA